MESKHFMELVSLCDRAGLPLIDLRDDVRRHFKDSEARDRILRNLEAIQKAVQEIPRDISKISKGESPSKYEYEWPRPKIAV